jgi:hypothetical protein
MMVEALGLRLMSSSATTMAAVGHGSDLDKEYFGLVREKGLKTGLQFRQQSYK